MGNIFVKFFVHLDKRSMACNRLNIKVIRAIDICHILCAFVMQNMSDFLHPVIFLELNVLCSLYELCCVLITSIWVRFWSASLAD
jgi:hypothetical protein